MITSYYTNRGGLSDHGTACGIFCVRAGHDASIAYWNIGATLLFDFILSYS